MSEGFDKPHRAQEQELSGPSFEGLDATIMPDPMRQAGAYMLQFPHGDAVTTLRIVFNDYSGADVVITHMTTLPSDQTGKGHGSDAVQKVVAWARGRGMSDIRAVQVQRPSEGFWEKNGFTKMEAPNPTNDFIFKG